MVLLPFLGCHGNLKLFFSLECLNHRDFVISIFRFSYIQVLGMDIPNMVFGSFLKYPQFA